MFNDSDCCNAVGNELFRVQSKLTFVKSSSDKNLEDLLINLSGIEEDFQKNDSPNSKLDSDVNLSLKDAVQKVQNICKDLSGQHKDLHSSISKLGKSIDKNFLSDYSAVARDFEDDQKITLLNEVICEHFLRQGRLSVAESLIQESDLELMEEMKQPFVEMYHIVQALREHNLSPALSWTERNSEQLKSIHSSLEFNLHRMKFLTLISCQSFDTSHRMAALNYVRTHLQKHSPTRCKDLQQLMGCFLFWGTDLKHSPYRLLISPNAWHSLIEEFSKDACLLLGLPTDSPLSVSISAGTKAIALLLHITGVMLQKRIHPVWGAKDELPVEIDLGHEARFHSIFACPILRQHTSENNPPMRLTCGHVISKDALQKLSTGHKMKCPYCPMEQSAADAMQLHL